jgi:hypothetical protein
VEEDEEGRCRGLLAYGGKRKKEEKKKEEEKIQSRIHSHPDDEASKEDAIELITHAQVLQQ